MLGVWELEGKGRKEERRRRVWGFAIGKGKEGNAPGLKKLIFLLGHGKRFGTSRLGGGSPDRFGELFDGFFNRADSTHLQLIGSDSTVRHSSPETTWI